jgi:hypothetical protein
MARTSGRLDLKDETPPENNSVEPQPAQKEASQSTEDSISPTASEKLSSIELPDSCAPTTPLAPAESVGKRMSEFENSIRWLTLAQTIVAILTCIILGLQLSEMHSGSADTHDLAVAAKAQSEAAKAIAESAKSQSEATARIAALTGEEVTQLKASVAEERTAIEHSDLSLQKSERPWVNAESMEVSGIDPPNPKHPSLTLRTKTIFRNTGKSVAVNGRVRIWIAPNSVKTIHHDWNSPCRMISQQKVGEAHANKLGLGMTWPVGFVLAPGESVGDENSFGGSDITENNYQSGYWILGCTTYDDQFGNHHHTNFCFQPDGPGDTPSSTKFRACNGFEEAN